MERRHLCRAGRRPAPGHPSRPGTSCRTLVPTALWAVGALVLGSLVTAPPAAADTPAEIGLLSGSDRLEMASAEGARIELALEPGVRFARAESLDGGWLVAGVRDDAALLLLRAHDARGGEPERMGVPAAGGAMVAAPTPIVHDGRLLGMAWLAGDAPRRLAVRWAEWLGDGWGPGETVSPPGPGSQVALVGAAVGDGSVLLAWSAFDGEDDEILWSLRSEGSWSPAARIAADNAVPDITPAVTVDGGRPLAVWSRFDGGSYSLVLSRFADGAWSEPEPITATGALFPRVRPSAAGPLVLYRDVPAGGWTVLRLDSQLRPAARATFEAPGDARPAILGSDLESLRVVPGAGRDEVTLRWER